jgi:hypothetical protein
MIERRSNPIDPQHGSKVSVSQPSVAGRLRVATRPTSTYWRGRVGEAVREVSDDRRVFIHRSPVRLLPLPSPSRP